MGSIPILTAKINIMHNFKFEVVDEWPCARCYVENRKTSVFYRLFLNHPKPDWLPQDIWDEAINYDSETMF